MVVKKKNKGKERLKEKEKKIKKRVVDEEDEEDNWEVEDGESEKEMENDIENVEEEVKKLQNVLSDVGSGELESVNVTGSKPISALKKGDKIKVDGKEYDVDAHYVLIDHGKTKEMVIELFDSSNDKDYQLRYFSDQFETSLEFYELQEILYVKKRISKVEW